MFEVGFQELALIFAIALVVLGPSRMSGLVNKVGRWVGKARVMARDFRQQLENEVNLEELNKVTQIESKPAGTTPAPPPEHTGAPATESPPTYPYSSQPEYRSPTDDPLPDDTYSHAHAAGGEPMPYTPEPAVAEAEVPTQTDLDLSVPDESHLPPDDARRTT
jgi:sec-independent protein translocase protein TatB